MVKKILLILVTLLLISNVSAWSYENSRTYGDAHAYVQVTGTYPVCEGKLHGSYCSGRWYVDISHQGDKLYIAYMLADWPSPSKAGYSLEQTSDGRKYIDMNGQVPKYIICAHDYDSADDGSWAWAGMCGGYIGNQYLDGLKNVACYDNTDCSSDSYCQKTGEWNSWRCIPKECENGQDKCIGSSLIVCKDYKWADTGGNPGKCGYCVNATTDCKKDVSLAEQDGKFTCEQHLCVWNQSLWSKVKIWFKDFFSKWKIF